MNKRILITGGAGFIGVNAAKYFLDKQHEVVVLDNLSRAGTKTNLSWLENFHAFEFEHTDITDKDALWAALERHRPDVIIHLAAQVAVTTSIQNPVDDFEINARATLNILEFCRVQVQKPMVIFSSTNKVYGDLAEEPLVERDDHWLFAGKPDGIDEATPLDFHSPYGCSKGVADQYCLDYARVYGVDTVVFRQSCIYGQRQLGVEDQGWVAWFMIAATLGKKITIFGDGKQVRDVLHISDLCSAFEAAIDCRSVVSGHAYNIGGGAENTLSILQLVDYIRANSNQSIKISWAEQRQGDQKIYVSNVGKFFEHTGWQPKVNVAEGLDSLLAWVRQNEEQFQVIK